MALRVVSRAVGKQIFKPQGLNAVMHRQFCDTKLATGKEQVTGMELKEMEESTDVFWSRDGLSGPRGTKENPTMVPSFNSSRVVGVESDEHGGLVWFHLNEGPLHYVAGEYFKLQKM